MVLAFLQGTYNYYQGCSIHNELTARVLIRGKVTSGNVNTGHNDWTDKHLTESSNQPNSLSFRVLVVDTVRIWPQRSI